MKSFKSPPETKPVDRLSEVCHILALGVLRMNAREKEGGSISSPFGTENLVDFPLGTERSCCRSQEKGGKQ